jgi:hypothetical protein
MGPGMADAISAKGQAMTNQPAPTSANAKSNAVVSVLLPWLLIGHFLWNVLTPSHQWPLRTEQVLTMAFDFLMLAGLIGLRGSTPNPLFWGALVSGVGLFALRLTSKQGWWTGHLF